MSPSPTSLALFPSYWLNSPLAAKNSAQLPGRWVSRSQTKNRVGVVISIPNGLPKTSKSSSRVTRYFARAAIPGNACRGAIYLAGGLLNATNCLFVGNWSRGSPPSGTHSGSLPTPGSGGAIYGLAGTMNLRQCVFQSNGVLGSSGYLGSGSVPVGDASGGAIFSAGNLVASACAFSHNTAAGGDGYVGAYPEVPQSGSAGGNAFGGAVANSGVLLADSCAFANNSASGGTGGPGASGGIMIGIYYSQAGGAGGEGGTATGSALFTAAGSSAALVNCTAALNTQGGGGGGYGGAAGVFSWNPMAREWGSPAVTGATAAPAPGFLPAPGR